MESKKTLWLVAIVGALAVAVIAVVALKPKKEAPHDQSQTTDQSKEPKVTRQDIDPTKVPEKIPVGLPFESGAVISQNYAATSEDGRWQATRAFETKKTLAENYKFYTDYFTKNSWKIVATLDQEQVKSVAASKEGILVQVSISENSVTHVRTVDVTASSAPVFPDATK